VIMSERLAVDPQHAASGEPQRPPDLTSDLVPSAADIEEVWDGLLIPAVGIAGSRRCVPPFVVF
jgi:hypothetical protein